jgi:hypothetical protein
MECGCSLPHSQEPPVLSQINVVLAPVVLFLEYPFNIILPHLPICLPICLFPSDSPQKSCMPCSCISYILHAPPISFLIWATELYPVTSTNHAACHNASSSCPLFPRNFSKPSTQFLLRFIEHPILPQAKPSQGLFPSIFTYVNVDEF